MLWISNGAAAAAAIKRGFYVTGVVFTGFKSKNNKMMLYAYVLWDMSFYALILINFHSLEVC